MRTIASNIFAATVVLGLASAAGAQAFSSGVEFDPLTPVQRFQTPVSNFSLSQIWIGGNGSQDGLGYEGSYATLGTIFNLGSDRADGMWNLDVRAHISERGNPFANFGVVRSSYFDVIDADISMSAWFDYDDDQFENFGHSFQQLGFSTQVCHRKFEFTVNSYIPVGATEFVEPSCFVGNQLVVPGVDVALQGFDTTLGLRPKYIEPYAGVIYFGGYYYRSDFTDPLAEFPGEIAGFSTGLSLQPYSGFNVNFQVNHDDFFKTTGFLGFSLHFGGSRGRGCEPGSCVPQPWQRNDHIVRHHRDRVILFNPDTGAPYNVVHVDSDGAAGAAVGTGTAEDPFSMLAQADPAQGGASGPNDIIFVDDGANDLANHNTGITLQAGQRLLGDGVAHTVPVQANVLGGTYTICNNVDGLKPTITNTMAGGVPVAGNVVTLAEATEVAGFNMTPDAAGNPYNNGVVGVGIMNATIRDNMIINPSIDGIMLTGSLAGGTTTISDNMITYNMAIGAAGPDAIEILGAAGGTFDITGNRIMDNFAMAGDRDGIAITGTANGIYNITDNVITGMGGNGVELGGTMAAAIARGTFVIDDNIITMSGADAINATNVAGPVGMTGFLTITDNLLNLNVDDGIDIGLATLDVAAAPALMGGDRLNALISGNTIEMNTDDGITSSVNDNRGTAAITLMTSITGNPSISMNGGNGILATAATALPAGGPAAGGGATHILSILGNPAIDGNGGMAGAAGAAGINISVSGLNPASMTSMTASISGNSLTGNIGGAGMNGDTSGISTTVTGNSNLSATVTDNVMSGVGGGAGNDGINFNYSVTNGVMNTVVLTGNQVSNHGDGVRFDLSANTQLQVGGALDAMGQVTDVAMNNNLTDNTQDGFHMSILNMGALTSANVRLFLNTNSFLRNANNGIDLNTFGNQPNAGPPAGMTGPPVPLFNVLKATVSNNSINSNGLGMGALAAGVLGTASGESAIGLELLSNDISSNGLQGALFTVNANPAGAPPPPPARRAQMDVIVRDNELNNNDLAAAGTSFDLIAQLVEPSLSPAPRICIELTNNLATSGFLFDDNTAGGVGGAGRFDFEDGGGNVPAITFDFTGGMEAYNPQGAGSCQTNFDLLNPPPAFPQ